MEESLIKHPENARILDCRIGDPNPRKHPWRKAYLKNIWVYTEAAILSCLVVLIIILSWEIWTSPRSGPEPSYRAGSDLSGVVPADFSFKTVIKPWEKHSWQVSEEAFTNIEKLNDTISVWESLNIPFIQASGYNGGGPEVPLPLDLFEISAFHQIHCLGVILEDFVHLAQGVPVAKLPSNSILEDRLTWSEHTAHCFNYVLDALLCFADSTAEGGRKEDPWVVHMEAKHVCNDFGALLEWSKKPAQQIPAGLQPIGK